jgi:hypothetical protein
MTDQPISYNVAAIRELLTEAFTPEDLRRFCEDRPIFRPVVARFGPGMGLDDSVDEVITYCRTRLLFPELLAAVEETNPRQYASFERQLRTSRQTPAHPPPSTKSREGGVTPLPRASQAIESDLLSLADLPIRSGKARLEADMLEASEDSVGTKLNIDHRLNFAKLVVASRLTDQRRTLCDWIGVEPDELAFLEYRTPLDFAFELIADCEKKGLDDALMRLMVLVTEELRDSRRHQARLADLHEVLGPDAQPAKGVPNEPSISVGEQRSSIIDSNEVRYSDTHIVSVLQIWSPMVVVWMFLLTLAPTHYEKYINRFRSSTARNIHISLCCLLTFLPLLITALGADLKHTSLSG